MRELCGGRGGIEWCIARPWSGGADSRPQQPQRLLRRRPAGAGPLKRPPFSGPPV